MSTGWRMSTSSFASRSRSRKPRKFSFMTLPFVQFCLHPLPALDRFVLDAEEIEHAADGVVDEPVDRARTAIESGHGREDHAAHFGDCDHVAQVSEVERRLARDQH